MKQDIKSEQYQAKLLGELFKSYGLNHVTPTPSETNYKLAVYLMKTKGEKNGKHDWLINMKFVSWMNRGYDMKEGE